MKWRRRWKPTAMRARRPRAPRASRVRLALLHGSWRSRLQAAHRSEPVVRARTEERRVRQSLPGRRARAARPAAREPLRRCHAAAAPSVRFDGAVCVAALSPEQPVSVGELMSVSGSSGGDEGSAPRWPSSGAPTRSGTRSMTSPPATPPRHGDRWRLRHRRGRRGVPVGALDPGHRLGVRCWSTRWSWCRTGRVDRPRVAHWYGRRHTREETG
jgi:hypothetical protein